MKTETNYSNRLVDIELLQTITAPSGVHQVYMSLTKYPTKIVAGVQKLIQRYVLVFCNIKDSKFDEELGTDFIGDVKRGLIQTRESISTSFAFANSDVLSYIKKEDENNVYGNLSDDERIVNATLTNYDIDFSSNTLKLFISLETASGKNIPFVLPVTTART